MTPLTLCTDILKNTMESKKGAKCIGNWLKLLFWVCCILFFIYGLAPWMQSKSQNIQTLSTYINESGIDAGAIYYTEVEEVGEADLMIRDTFRFYLNVKKE